MKHLSLLLLWLFATAAGAGELVIRGDACKDRIHIHAVDVKLSELLFRLADHVGYQLKFDPAADRMISFTRDGRVVDALNELMRGQSLVTLEDAVPECNGARLPRSVWILPRGQGVDYVDYQPQMTHSTIQAAGSPRQPVQGASLPKGLKKLSKDDAEFQQLKEKASRGELVAHPDTGEPITREEYDETMKSRPQKTPITD